MIKKEYLQKVAGWMENFTGSDLTGLYENPNKFEGVDFNTHTFFRPSGSRKFSRDYKLHREFNNNKSKFTGIDSSLKEIKITSSLQEHLQRALQKAKQKY